MIMASQCGSVMSSPVPTRLLLFICIPHRETVPQSRVTSEIFALLSGKNRKTVLLSLLRCVPPSVCVCVCVCAALPGGVLRRHWRFFLLFFPQALPLMVILNSTQLYSNISSSSSSSPTLPIIAVAVSSSSALVLCSL